MQLSDFDIMLWQV